MSDLPGHLALHAPLAMLAPGLWLAVAAVALRIIPAGRGRALCAWAALALAALAAAAGWRAGWVMAMGTGSDGGALGTWQRDLLGGWVHGGFPWLAAGSLAAVAALLAAWPAGVRTADQTSDGKPVPGSWPIRLAAAAAGHLALVGLMWWAQVALALLLLGWSLRAWTGGYRARRVTCIGVIGILLLLAGITAGLLHQTGA